MEVAVNNNQTVSYDANGNKRVEERKQTESTFENDLNEAQKSTEETTSRLLEDINSLYKTGLTVNEFKKMQELFEMIKKKVDDLEPPLSTEEINEIDEMFKELERMILEFQRKIKGEAITEFKDSASNIKDKNSLEQNEIKKDDKNSIDIAGFLKRLENAKEAIDELKNNRVNNTNKTSEELELLQRLKQAI